jgi:hypothetical protein
MGACCSTAALQDERSPAPAPSGSRRSSGAPGSPPTPSQRRVHLREALIHGNDRIPKDLEEVKQLGQGLSGAVMLVRHKETKMLYALKKMRKGAMQANQLASFRQEVDLLRELDHPNIVKLYEYFEVEATDGGEGELCLCVGGGGGGGFVIDGGGGWTWRGLSW